MGNARSDGRLASVWNEVGDIFASLSGDWCVVIGAYDVTPDTVFDFTCKKLTQAGHELVNIVTETTVIMPIGGPSSLIIWITSATSDNLKESLCVDSTRDHLIHIPLLTIMPE